MARPARPKRTTKSASSSGFSTYKAAYPTGITFGQKAPGKSGRSVSKGRR